jgi:Antirestriction protein (ArdA)
MGTACGLVMEIRRWEETMADGSFNVNDINGNNVEITVFEIDNCAIDDETLRLVFETTDGEKVELPAEVTITDNTFGFTIREETPVTMRDFELMGNALEEMEGSDDLAAYVAWVNDQGFHQMDWKKWTKDFKEAYQGSYENFAEFARENLDDVKDAGYYNFIDFEEYGKWLSEGYTILLDADEERSKIHMFTG